MEKLTAPSANATLASNAMANAARRKIVTFLAEKERTKDEIEEAAGVSLLDYHLLVLQQAGLTEIKAGKFNLTDFGKNFTVTTSTEKLAESKKTLFGTAPLHIIETRQLLPCIADNSKLRIIAWLEPALGGDLKLIMPLFPSASYSEKIDALKIKSGDHIITFYSTGKVTVSRITSAAEANEIIEYLEKKINEAIASAT